MDNRLKKLTYTVMFTAVNYVVFTYGKINIVTAPGHSTAIHVANSVLMLSAWLLGPLYGGIAGNRRAETETAGEKRKKRHHQGSRHQRCLCDGVQRDR